MGLAVIFLTLFIRVLLLPFSIRAARSEHRLKKLQPEFEEIKHRFKYDVQKQREAIKKILKDNKIGVLSNVFSLLFQLLFFIVLYTIFSSGLQEVGKNQLYGFALNPGVIDPFFLDWINLILPHNGVSLFAAAVVFLHQAIRKVGNLGDASTLEKALIFGLPLGTYFATIVLPSAKGIFIATSVLFSMWLRLVRWVITKYVIKDEELKENIKSLWTN